MGIQKRAPWNCKMVRLIALTMLALTLLSLTPFASVVSDASPARVPQVPPSMLSGEPGAWTKYSGNPVLIPSQGWEGVLLWSPHVIRDGATYKMWYTGWGYRIGYATSTDGLAWAKYSGNPILTAGVSGQWDAYGVGEPYVMKDGSGYKMWYWGINASGLKQIGYASSLDGIAWTKYSGNPVLAVGSPGSWDEIEAGAPCVVYQNGTYQLWYTGQDTVGHYAIGYATSPDGITWTRYGSNPIVVSTPGAWDQNGVLASRILFDSTTYRMWYFGKDNSGTNRTGYARSPDGLHWTKYMGNPILDLGFTDAWDATGVYFPSVILDSGLYKMWYVGEGSSTPPRIGYATAPEVHPVYLPIILK